LDTAPERQLDRLATERIATGGRTMADGKVGVGPRAWTTPGSLPALAALAALVLGLSSCVSAERYKEAQDATKHYQRALHDLEQYQAQLEAEVEALRAQKGLGSGAPVDATFTKPIDDRIEELRRMEERIAGLGQEGDVTVVDFDGGYGYSLRDSVLFDSGSAEIQPAGLQVLQALAREIEGQAYDRIWVRGHTDSDRIVRKATVARFPHGNLELSAARAIEVASVLVDNGGVDAKRVVVAGFGPNEPVAPNDTAENKRRNRRVEIFVEQPKGAKGK
jgi:flagellar motor protein MotB